MDVSFTSPLGASLVLKATIPPVSYNGCSLAVNQAAEGLTARVKVQDRFMAMMLKKIGKLNFQ